jgi:hypothetical protein
MLSLTRNCLTASFALLLAFAFAQSAIADQAMDQAAARDEALGYQVSVWRNDTMSTIGGSFRWGVGPWQSFRISPGGSYAAWHADYLAPSLQITFDADPGPGLMYRNYTLRTYYSPTTVFSYPTELFIVQPNGLIDLLNTGG